MALSHQYTDAEKAEVIIKLAINHYNYQRTSDETGIPWRTLRRWASNAPSKPGIMALLERALERVLMQVPDDMGGRDWAIALGILMDKWLLSQNKATARSELVTKKLGGLSGPELDELLDEAESILSEAAQRRDLESIDPEEE